MKKPGLIFAFLLGFTFSSLSLTFTSINSGDWSDEIDVWSIDGVTECGCSPGNISFGSVIEINHHIVMDTDLLINGGTDMSINPSSTLIGTMNLFIKGASVNVYGGLIINKLTIDFFGNLNVNFNGIAISAARIEIYSGQLNVNSGQFYSINGNLFNHTYGSINLQSGSYIRLANGNITNYGQIDLCSSCCLSSSGNLKNLGLGHLKGMGAVQSTSGNIRNFAFADPSVSWCAPGFSFGMPSIEDCATANTICQYVTTTPLLPVELMSFDVSLIENNSAKLIWTTASEYDSDYFKIMKSTDGLNWVELSTIPAAGYSNTILRYNTIDTEVAKGLTYYKLTQVDYNGTVHDWGIRAIQLDGTNSEQITAIPNPAVPGMTIAINNLEKGPKTIQLLNSQGMVVAEQRYSHQNELSSFEIPYVSAGMYLLRIEGLEKIETIRLVVSE